MGKLISFKDAESFDFDIVILSSTCLEVKYKNKTLNHGSVLSCLDTIRQIFDDLNPSQVLNIGKACEELEKIQQTTSGGYCAREVRAAMDKAGLVYGNRGDAKYYHTSGWLRDIGYHEISEPTPPSSGDIAVQTYLDLKPTGDEKKDRSLAFGHISMYTGNAWISDFRQKYPRGRLGEAHFYRLKKTIRFDIRNNNQEDPCSEISKTAVENCLKMLRHGCQNQIEIHVALY